MPTARPWPLLLVVALAACGGGDAAPSDSLAVIPAAPATPVVSAPPAGSAAAITGAIIEVRMVGDGKGYRFEPATVKAVPGDGIKFVVISGGPHEVAFDLAAVPPESRDQLRWNMPNSTEGRSPLLSHEQETWTVSLGSLAKGRYPFVSTPRVAQGMKGEIVIQ